MTKQLSRLRSALRAGSPGTLESLLGAVHCGEEDLCVGEVLRNIARVDVPKTAYWCKHFSDVKLVRVALCA